MKKLKIISLLFTACIIFNPRQICAFKGGNEKIETSQEKEKNMKTIYDFKVSTIEGKAFDLSTLKGKKVMIVNTASECGYTPQYAGLEELYQKYKDKDFVIIGFPSNDFGGQEPGTNEQIASFCQKNFGVTFPMMEKITVKGSEKHPLYQFLTDQKANGIHGEEVKWNFQKFLIDENGRLIAVHKSAVEPMSDKITSWIEEK